MQEIPYNREAPLPMPAGGRWDVTPHTNYDFENIGGDCTNFASQCIYAGTPTILIAAHTYDSLYRPLSTYAYEVVRFLHIEGVRI